MQRQKLDIGRNFLFAALPANHFKDECIRTWNTIKMRIQPVKLYTVSPSLQ